jgi:hypothetical protein
MLVHEGYTIVHVSRHCGMEMGKDIIAISPEGIPCAYQLKTSQSERISLRQWNSEISQQVFNLVVGHIVHPSVDTSIHHQAYLVTNRNIEEEVSRAIDDMNRQWEAAGQKHLKLKTIVRGELIQKALNSGTGFWPVELEDLALLFELYLENGNELLPKEKLSSLLDVVFTREIKTRPPRVRAKRTISSAALLCSIAISNFSKRYNYLAEIEAWMIFISYMFGFAEKWRLSDRSFVDEFTLASQIIFNSMHNLFDELQARTHFVEGDPLVDPIYYKLRMTWLVALMSIYALWLKSLKKDEAAVAYIRSFCQDNIKNLSLYGEASIPQFLAFYWFYRKIDGSMKPDFLIRDLIEMICKTNGRKEGPFLSNPYYEAKDIVPYLIGIPDNPLNENFKGESYALEALVHLFVRRNWKQMMKMLWPEITFISTTAFVPEKRWHFYRWRNTSGHLKTIWPKIRQDWNELKALSLESSGNDIPPTIKKYPILLLLFLCVFPHRLNSQIVRWLDSQIREI